MAKKETTIENASEMNVFQKLLKARVMFLEKEVKKTGLNRSLEFKYFELNDIVPPITDIGNTLGLLFLTTFTSEVAKMTVVNTDKPEEIITFESPMKEIESKVSSRTGVEITNPIQNLGSAETYQRRYLYLTALDIVENDTIDGEASKDNRKTETESKKTIAKKAPATLVERAEIKQQVVGTDSPANEMQIKALKESLKKLREVAPDQESFIQEIALKTNGFTDIKKKACETLIVQISEMIEAYNASTTAE